MIRVLIFVFFCLLLACNSKERTTDSNVLKIDTSKSISGIPVKVNEVDSLSDAIDIDTSDYRVTKTIDTSSVFGKDTIYLRLSNYFDSSRLISIPIKYLELVNVSRFSTYELVYRVRIKRNSELVLDTLLSKSNFQDLADSTLQRFGILSLPNIYIYKDSIVIGFSYSIPLTDVGVYAPAKLKY